MEPTRQHALVLFDGVCNLCNGFVQFVIARDPAGLMQFGALQSAAARRVLDLHEVPTPMLDSVVLIEGGRLYTQSQAALRIARHLTFPWPLAYAFILIPRPLRDWAYAVLARNRYRWFGTRESCMVPTPELRSRFLD